MQKEPQMKTAAPPFRWIIAMTLGQLILNDTRIYSYILYSYKVPFFLKEKIYVNGSSGTTVVNHGLANPINICLYYLRKFSRKNLLLK